MKLRDCARLIALSLLLSAGAAFANETGEPPFEPEAALADTPSAGSAARQWLALQRSGAQASPHPQPLSGEVQQKIHERYVQSFSHPIPERLKQESAGTTSK
ncbi:conserved exported protein of unknown function [Thauera humireducens]|uniref:DUF3613 domain-containing protein n=1 Tax=Thauera humireducens TaxID=1134435 RepID=UPI002467A0A3|nr:DUF3613 domain-containing protein [Thauera humireducens]CAH1746296.1 conserved exported protein of unknown function [Thauera humireducens]